MPMINDRSDRSASFGAHRLGNVPLSAFESGALGQQRGSAAHRSGGPGGGEGVSSLLDLFTLTRRKVIIGAAASVAMIALIWLT